jgi:hypothetical protein
MLSERSESKDLLFVSSAIVTAYRILRVRVSEATLHRSHSARQP